MDATEINHVSRDPKVRPVTPRTVALEHGINRVLDPSRCNKEGDFVARVLSVSTVEDELLDNEDETFQS